MASFLWGQGKKERVLPELVQIHAARAFELPENTRGQVIGGLDQVGFSSRSHRADFSSEQAQPQAGRTWYRLLGCG